MCVRKKNKKKKIKNVNNEILNSLIFTINERTLILLDDWRKEMHKNNIEISSQEINEKYHEIHNILMEKYS